MDIVSQLVRDEGKARFRNNRYFPYKDTVGKLTIGVGRNLIDRGLSEEEIIFLLQNDIRDCTEAIQKTMPWAMNLDDARRGVLINLVFNMGISGVLQFQNMLGFMKIHDWKMAAGALRDSAAYKQEKNRIERLAIQLETGEWQ